MTSAKKKGIGKTLLYCIVIFVVVKICFGIYLDKIKKDRARERQEITRPISEKEIQAALDNLQPHIDRKKDDAEEWYRLNESSPSGDFMSKLLPDKALYFRGLNFNMTIDQVKAHEDSRQDTFLSPVPKIRPAYNMLTYWYYLEDGEVGFLNYHFYSSGRLETVVITITGPPLSRPEMEALVSIFSSTLGTPKKHSNYIYEWSAPTLKSFIFAFPSDRPAESMGTQLAIVYAAPHIFRSEDTSDYVIKLWEEMEKTEHMVWDVIDKAIDR